MKRWAGPLLLLVLLVPQAIAGTENPCPAGRAVCGAGNGDGFDVSAEASGGSGPRDVGGASGPTYRVVRFAPTCTPNSRQDPGALCGAAVATCPDPGDVAYWRWAATVDRRSGAVVDPPGWVQSPGSFCLGPSEAGLEQAPTIAALVSSQFARMPLPRGVVQVAPRGQTLAQLGTAFWTTAGDVDLPALTLLGRTVRVRAHAQRYEWSFGDGAVLTGGSRVSHVYVRAGRVSARVVITWTGTFTVDGGPVQQVVGTAVTEGPPTGLLVREAHAELVTR